MDFCVTDGRWAKTGRLSQFWARGATRGRDRPPPGRSRAESGLARFILRLALVVAAALWSVGAHARCFGSLNPDVQRLEAAVIRDARKAIAEAERQRIELLRSPHADPQQLASLYAIEAQGYSLLDLDADARTTALKGLALAPGPTDPIHLNLLSIYAENQFDEDGLRNAAASIEDARTLQTKGSRADTCLLVTLGQVKHYQGRDDLAIVDLIQAYGATGPLDMADTRARAAAALAVVLVATGDLDQALALNQDVIDWDTANGATQRLSESRFRRGEILARQHDYPAALAQFTEVRQLSVALRDEQGIGFADLRACEVYIELKQPVEARKRCTGALKVFMDSSSIDMAKEARSFLARIDLVEGRTWRALTTLNGVMDTGGSDLSQARLTAVYKLRAQANAALENYRDAYADLSQYIQRYMDNNDADRARNVATLRARFGADRSAEHNAALRRELELERAGADRQRDKLRWVAATAVAAMLIIALLTYVLLENSRNRRKLQELATLDGLTGLANRRRTAEVAIEALAHAATAGTPLTIAIIDLDHFKGINDRYGHAVGDQVLKDFARLGRELLLPTDTLGRWGGEEFLLVMPDSPLDLALARVEALRVAVLTICLPPTTLGYQVSLSAGLASSDQAITSLDDIIARADVALYEAKKEGRDLVRIADESYQTASTGVRRALRQR